MICSFKIHAAAEMWATHNIHLKPQGEVFLKAERRKELTKGSFKPASCKTRLVHANLASGTSDASVDTHFLICGADSFCGRYMQWLDQEHQALS